MCSPDPDVILQDGWPVEPHLPLGNTAAVFTAACPTRTSQSPTRATEVDKAEPQFGKAEATVWGEAGQSVHVLHSLHASSRGRRAVERQQQQQQQQWIREEYLTASLQSPAAADNSDVEPNLASSPNSPHLPSSG